MSKEIFQFKEFDLEGMQTLEAMAAAPRLNDWMYHTISKNFSGKVLEIGSGIGNISEYFIKNNQSIHLTDIRDNYLKYLNHRFSEEKVVSGISQLDLVHLDFENEYSDLIGTFDAVFALNVVEHIEDDLQAITNCKKLLKKGGRLLILVPAYQSLYNGFDKALEHYRRYNRTSLSELFTKNDFEITRKQHFNFAGIFGWYFTGSILKKEIIPKGQMKLYNTLVPIFKIADKMILNQMGLSVIVEGVKR